MHPMLAFYKQTWWLWLLFLAVFVGLSYYVSPLFVIMIPGLILYSLYFGVVRTSELAELKAQQRADPDARQPAAGATAPDQLP